MKYQLLTGLAVIGLGINSVFAASNVYDVIKLEQTPPTEKYDATFWQQVPAIEGSFHYPWRDFAAPYTSFRAYHDADKFYFVFDVKDDDIIAPEQWDGESTVNNEDRVELFFAQDTLTAPEKGKLKPYYAAEIDPRGRVHDYSAIYYRNYDHEWGFEGLKTYAWINDAGYTVQGEIPLATLRDLNVLKEDGSLRAGVFRADYKNVEGTVDKRWMSWVNPQTAKPDFHVDSAFGLFRLLK